MTVHYTTTISAQTKGKMPYHFICNYCGRRTDVIYSVIGAAQMTIDGAHTQKEVSKSGLGTMIQGKSQQNMVNTVNLINMQTENYAEWLRTGKKKEFDGANYEKYTPDDLSSMYRYSLCDHCGKRQVWGINPKQELSGGTAKMLSGIILGVMFLMFSGLALAAGGRGAALTFAIIGALAGVVSAIVGLLNKKTYLGLKKTIEEGPNDPDKLPVLDCAGEDVLFKTLTGADDAEELKKVWFCRKCGMKNKNSNRTCAGCGAEK